jgi:hypothetical protein
MRIILFAFVLVIAVFPSLGFAQPTITGDQAAVGIGFLVSAGGAGLFTFMNSLDATQGVGDRGVGAMGILFGASLIAFTAVAQADDEMGVKYPAVWYALGGTSVTLGVLGWSRDSMAVEPVVSLGEEGASVGIVFRTRF